jgi:hypothetical protein
MQCFSWGYFSGVSCLPLNVTNAYWNSTATSYESVVNVTCHQGFEISTDQYWVVVECQANQAWSIESLKCNS